MIRTPYLVSACLVTVTLVACGVESDGPYQPSSDLTNRAYSGAPPVISHEVEALGRGECLSCHRDGDTVDKKGRVAGKTPHPELDRCVQCHVEVKDQVLFVDNTFEGKAYKTGARSQPSGPWLIPHPITMRENCLACHGADGVNQSIVTSHPERRRCVQCHVPAHEEFPGTRPDAFERGDVEWANANWSL